MQTLFHKLFALSNDGHTPNVPRP